MWVRVRCAICGNLVDVKQVESETICEQCWDHIIERFEVLVAGGDPDGALPEV